MHFPSLRLLAAAYQGAPDNPFFLAYCSYFAAVSHFVVLYFTDHVDVSSCPAPIQQFFSYTRGFFRTPGHFQFHFSPLGDYGGAERAPSSHGLPNPWTCGYLDGFEQRGGVPFLCHDPIAILSLYSTLFEMCTWGGYWVRECYSSTAEVFFVYVGLTPVCGEDRSSCELQNALCRRVSPVRTSFSGGPSMGLIS